MPRTDTRSRGREAFAEQRWVDAYEELCAADQTTPLQPDDLERLAIAAYMTGRDEASDDTWARAHRGYLTQGNVDRAARCAVWCGFLMVARGDETLAGAWLQRARELLEEHGIDSVVQGYLLVPAALMVLYEDASQSLATFEQVHDVGRRFDERDLMTMGLLGQGQALLQRGDTAAGVARLDQAMLSGLSDDVSPIVTGIVYCAGIETLQGVFDLRRAREWTEALHRWCTSSHDPAPYRGICLAHRAQIMELGGAWPDAIEQAKIACERLASRPIAGIAWYQLGELHRLRGAFDDAEEAYRRANQFGRDPQPGLALLRVAQGRVEAAVPAIRRVINEAHTPIERTKVLPGYIEVMLAAGDVTAARTAADELSAVAAGVPSSFLRALAAYSAGAVQCAEGDAHAACETLRTALGAWQELEAPYLGARARELIAVACRAIGDEDTAQLELAAALDVYRKLGAAPDLARLEGVARPRPGALTDREAEVLRLVASGKTNRAIASELVLSEKTVARHISNIFTKLGVSSRSAATAWAYEHDLVS